PLDGERDFTTENFYTISTDTHIDHLVILPIVLLCGANKNAAGTMHFEPLLDQDLLIARSNAVRNHPGGAASGGRSSGRIFSVVKNHAGVEAGFGIDGFAANKIEESPSAAREIFGSAVEIEAEVLQRLQRTQRGDGERHAGRDGLDGRGTVEVSRAEAREARDVVHVVDRAELGILLRHLSESGQRWILGETHRDGADVQVKPDFGCAGLATQNESRAERRMSGEGQFFLHGEDAHADSAILFRSGVPGK